MFDCIIRNIVPFYKDGCGPACDIAVRDGVIVAVEPHVPGEAFRVIDGEGGLCVPSFVDSHTHLDKVLVGQDRDADGLMAAIALFDEYQRSVPSDRIIDDIRGRAARVVDRQRGHGTGFVKTHVILDDIWGSAPIEALDEVKLHFAGEVDIRLIVPWMGKASEKILEPLARAGKIDFLGGYPTLMPDQRESLDRIFAFALRHSLPIDLHVDEADEPNIDTFEYALDKILETGMQGRVSAGHVTALCAVDDGRARRAIDKAARAGIHIITLPSCNMYLMGRKDKQPIRRGVTRVDEFLKAGVNVAFASDNIRDPFRPFGNGDMLEEALFAAQVLQYGTNAQLHQILRMATYAPAQNMLLEGYGLKAGCRADLVVLDATTPRDAVVGQVPRRVVMKGGRVL